MKPRNSLVGSKFGSMLLGAGALVVALGITGGVTDWAAGQCCEPHPHMTPEPPAGPLAWILVEQRSGDDEGRVAVVVDHDLYVGHLEVQDAIETFADDLDAEGHAVVAFLFNGTAEQLRGELQTLYGQGASLSGAVLVGDLPFVVFELENDSPHGYVDFPADAFFMDMDGVWEDNEEYPEYTEFPGGKYDTWIDSGGRAEIWVSRIKTSDLPAIQVLGQPVPQEDIIVAYFARNHALRSNPDFDIFGPASRTLVYADTDEPRTPELHCTTAALSRAFDAEIQMDWACSVGTTRSNYILRLLGQHASPPVYPDYHYIHEVSHGSVTQHGFWNSGSMEYVSGTDYLEMDPAAVGFSLMSCQTCDFAHYRPEFPGQFGRNFLGGLVAFNPEGQALVVFGYSKAAHVSLGHQLWQEVGIGRPFGEGYKAQFNGPDNAAQLGFVLLGDGSLKARSRRWDGGGLDSSWSTVENWEGDELPGNYAHVRISGATVQVEPEWPYNRVWSVDLREGAELEIDPYRGLYVQALLRAEAAAVSTITMRARSFLELRDLANVTVVMEETPAGSTTDLVASGAIKSATITVNENCHMDAEKIEDSEVTVAAGSVVNVGVINDCVFALADNGSLTGPTTISRSRFQVGEAASVTTGSLVDCGFNVETGATVTASGGISGAAGLDGTPDWGVYGGSVEAGGQSRPWGTWDMSGGSAAFEEMYADGTRALHIILLDGSEVGIAEMRAESLIRTFPNGPEHDLAYGSDGTRANQFGGGSTDAPVDRMYFGDNTRISVAEGVSDASLNLDLRCELHIASDFRQRFVYEGWDTRGVDVTAHAINDPGDAQVIELISPLRSASLNPPHFGDVPCVGAFRDLTLPDGGGQVAPTVMRNLYDNSEYGWPTATGWFEDVYVGDDRKLDFYEDEGAIHYSGDRVINGTVRYWHSGVPMIVTEHSTPALDDLIIPAVATLYGDWNGDCVISNIELVQLQAAVAGGSSTYDPLMDSNCDGVLSNVELAKFLDNMLVQPPCGGRDGGGERGEGEGEDWASEEDGGAEEEEGAGEGSGGEDGVDVAELAAWIMTELSPEELAVFVADLAAAATEFAGTRAGADMAALLAEFE